MDTVSADVRSRMMQAVRRRDTKPEIAVRRALHSAGYRYRLHPRALPGRPDLVLARFKIAVFVHGCFWHGHDCRRGTRPGTNTRFWDKKIDGNVERDRRNQGELKELGWKPVVVWTCRLEKDTAKLIAMLTRARA